MAGNQFCFSWPRKEQQEMHRSCPKLLNKPRQRPPGGDSFPLCADSSKLLPNADDFPMRKFLWQISCHDFNLDGYLNFFYAWDEEHRGMVYWLSMAVTHTLESAIRRNCILTRIRGPPCMCPSRGETEHQWSFPWWTMDAWILMTQSCQNALSLAAATGGGGIGFGGHFRPKP